MTENLTNHLISVGNCITGGKVPFHKKSYICHNKIMACTKSWHSKEFQTVQMLKEGHCDWNEQSKESGKRRESKDAGRGVGGRCAGCCRL